jgi:hypothetical protein
MYKGKNIVYGGNIKVVAVGEIYEASRSEDRVLPQVTLV